MPPFITALIPAVIGLVKGMFTTASDNKRQVETAKSAAEKAAADAAAARANAEAAKADIPVAEDQKNASLSQSNKHIYTMIIILGIVGILVAPGIWPEAVNSFIHNIESVFSPKTIERLLNLLEEVVRALVGVTQE